MSVNSSDAEIKDKSFLLRVLGENLLVVLGRENPQGVEAYVRDLREEAERRAEIVKRIPRVRRERER